jgi:hypothetical protein
VTDLGFFRFNCGDELSASMRPAGLAPPRPWLD